MLDVQQAFTGIRLILRSVYAVSHLRTSALRTLSKNDDDNTTLLERPPQSIVIEPIELRLGGVFRPVGEVEIGTETKTGGSIERSERISSRMKSGIEV